MEVGGLGIACGRGAQISKSRTVVVARDHLGELRVLSSERSARVLGLRPVQAAVLGHGDLRVPIHVDVAEVDGVVRACRNGRVAAGADALGVGHGPHDPAQTVVGRNGYSWPADAGRVHAFLVGNIGSTVRRNANVPVQTAAGSGGDRAVNTANAGEDIDGKAGSEGEAAVIAPRAEGRHDVLRAVVDGVRICVHRHRHGVWTASDGLMVNACWLAGTLGRQPGVTVVIGEG